MARLLTAFASCDALRRVTLSFRYPYLSFPPDPAVPFVLYSDDISLVEQALLQFKHLDTVTILKHKESTPLAEQSPLSERMPTLHERGVLNFQADTVYEQFWM